MAKFTFRLPDIGEGIAEAEIVTWHVKIGDVVREDQPLADMMTDKATVEMESPKAGTITALAGAVGDMIAIGSMLVEIEIAGDAEVHVEAPADASQTAPQAPVETVVDQDASNAEIIVTPPPVPVASLTPEPPSLVPLPAQHDVLASPAVRARAADLHIDLAHVPPGPAGRVRHADLDAYLAHHSGYSGAAPARADEVIKIVGMRRRISENMSAAKRHIPHFTYVEEIDVTALEATREELNATRGSKPKLTLLPLLITAICRTLPDYPMINARFDDEAGVVTRFGAVHLGMATQTKAGLMVPVIHDAQDKNIWQLAAEIGRLAEAARAGTAKSTELSGSTVTITSLGPLGGIATTPIINRPEVAIIGPNRIIERPVFDGDTIKRAKLMNLSISCDHRVVDGWDAASFVQAIKWMLEKPVLLFAPA